MKTRRKSLVSLRRKHSHELFKRFERLSKLKSRFILNVNVREERGVVKRIEPRPASHSFVVIFDNPAEGFNIGDADISPELYELSRLNSKLFPVIFLLIIENLMTENRIILQIVLNISKFPNLLLKRT